MMEPGLIQAGDIPFPLYRSEEHACPYLEGLKAAELVVLAPRMSPESYQGLMDRGFRRSGSYFYRPNCGACQRCVPIRLAVAGFSPSKSQRRVERRNADLRVEVGPPVLDDERLKVYELYQRQQHKTATSLTREHYRQFFCESPINTVEMSYWLGSALLGVGILDVCPDALSSVYFYFHPAYARRSLGVYSGLREIAECRRRGLGYWYLGYYVAGCRKMEYKTRFRPFELLEGGRVWRAAGLAQGTQAGPRGC